MSDITKEEKQARKELLNKCYSYLCDNFHKFNETNKIRIALELVKKSMPSDINLGGQENSPIIVKVQDMVFNQTDEGSNNTDSPEV